MGRYDLDEIKNQNDGKKRNISQLSDEVIIKLIEAVRDIIIHCVDTKTQKS